MSFKRILSTSIILLLFLVPQAKAQTVGFLDMITFNSWSVSGPNGFYHSDEMWFGDLVLDGGPGVYTIAGVEIDGWFVSTDPGYSVNPEAGDGPGMFTISETASPITLTSFIGSAKNGTIELAWETASETNNARFVIYRNDEAIASVDGAGTTSETQNYTYSDNTVVPGVEYTYVLADVDYANEENKYDAKAITLTLSNNALDTDFILGAAYPNPFNPQTAISYQLPVDGQIDVNIFNSRGKKVATLVSENQSAGSHTHIWNASNLTSGIYIVKAITGDMIKTQKIILLK